LEYLSKLTDIKIENVETLYCCADIIESAFGKFKQKINPKSTHTISEFVLTLAKTYQEEEIRDALYPNTFTGVVELGHSPCGSSTFK